MASDLAVQRFKSAHGLLTSDGKLVSDQQLTELSTQLIMAQSDRAKAEARYTQIATVIDKGDVKGVVSGTLESPVINDLRQKYLVTAQLEAQIADSLGPHASSDAEPAKVDGRLHEVDLRRDDPHRCGL